MTGPGGPPEPDRARRFELYRKFRTPQLRTLDRRMVGLGAACAFVVGFALAATTVLADVPGMGPAAVLAVGAGGLIGAYLWWVGRWQYDRVMRGEWDLPALPRSDTVALSWVGPSDASDLASALDPGLMSSLDWSEADRTEFLDLAMLPGFAAEGLRWLVRDPRTGDLLGFVTAGVDEAEPTVPTCSLRLVPAAQGRGLGRAALELVLPAQHALLREPAAAPLRSPMRSRSWLRKATRPWPGRSRTSAGSSEGPSSSRSSTARPRRWFAIASRSLRQVAPSP